jgi:predicted metal-dependent hydrolase
MNQPALESGNIAVGDIQIPFTVLRSRRRRRSIGFDMEPPAMLRISAPMRMSLSTIQFLVKKHSSWITRRLGELKTQDLRPHHQRFTDNDAVIYLGHKFRLQVTCDERAPQGVRVWPRRMEINIHADGSSAEARRQEVRLEIMLWLKKRAKAKLQKRMDYWAERLNVKYKKLAVGNADRRWGSCNAQNMIRLNWRLILAPLTLLDYVVVHELAHIPHKNHSPCFWRCVASVVPDYLARRKHLRRIGSGLVL